MRKVRRRALAGAAIVATILLAVVAQGIWQFNWNTFLPDLIVGAFTGLAVGLVLWRVEISSGRLSRKADASREWSVVRALVSRAVGEGSAWKSDSLEVQGFGIFEVRQAVANQPLSYWAEELDSDEIRTLLAYLDAAEDADFQGRSIDLALNGASHKYDQSRNQISTFAVRSARDFIDLIRDPHTPADGDVDEVWELLSNERVQRLIPKYRAAILGLESAWEDLRATLADLR